MGTDVVPAITVSKATRTGRIIHHIRFSALYLSMEKTTSPIVRKKIKNVSHQGEEQNPVKE
jgi:hypothetical protein